MHYTPALFSATRVLQVSDDSVWAGLIGSLAPDPHGVRTIDWIIQQLSQVPANRFGREFMGIQYAAERAPGSARR